MTRFASRAASDATAAATTLSHRGWLGRRFFAGRRPAPRIDPDALPEAMRRDLGFADGRFAGRRDPRWD